MQLGGFMQLIVKLDEGNMRAVRQAWEKHGRPLTVRELLQAEVAAGVQEPTRLKEVCGARRQPLGTPWRAACTEPSRLRAAPKSLPELLPVSVVCP